VSSEIELDGNLGGGSVIRVGVPLALALQRPLHITNVRHQRLRRGLQEQHLSGLQILKEITGATFSGDHLGSVELFVESGTGYTFDLKDIPVVNIPTAGAVSLVYQTLSNYCFASRNPAGFDFTGGGSHVQFAPNFDVLHHVNVPIFEKFGLQSAVQLNRPGFFPKGGAKGRILMNPIDFGQVQLEEGEMTELLAIASMSREYEKDRLGEQLIKGFRQSAKPTSQFAGYAEADCKGGALSAILKYDNGLAKAIARVYQGKLDPLELGRTTAKAAKKISYNGVAVDEQLADQLIVPLAFAPRGSSYTFDKRYQHVNTNIQVVEQIMGPIFDIEEIEGGFRIIRK
jgi:RNA 3'-terminal phosphate cyclase (ATP)